MAVTRKIIMIRYWTKILNQTDDSLVKRAYLMLKSDAENKYKVALSRFRTSSHDLRIETGRYDNIPQEQRLCNSCNMEKVEDEFHFLLVCPKYRDLRCKYFKRYFCHWPTIHKFETLMSSTSNEVLNSIAKYIYYALKTHIS